MRWSQHLSLPTSPELRGQPKWLPPPPARGLLGGELYIKDQFASSHLPAYMVLSSTAQANLPEM